MPAARPVLDQLNLVVSDMEATLAFYRRLGLVIDDEQVWRTSSGAHHAQATGTGGVQLEFDSVAMAAFWDPGLRPPSGGGARGVIGFSLPSREEVDDLCADLAAAGAAVSQPPTDMFWGARYAIVEDPDGNHVGLMSPSDPARRSPPPEL
ncbi:MAG: VOC family protein [Actinomycetota bacterium]|nr:VOC family protein [Actinomycetota bacterium]